MLEPESPIGGAMADKDKKPAKDKDREDPKPPPHDKAK